MDFFNMMDLTVIPDLNTIPLMSDDPNEGIFDFQSSGIEANDLSSLLSQFEEASQSQDDFPEIVVIPDPVAVPPLVEVVTQPLVELIPDVKRKPLAVANINKPPAQPVTPSPEFLASLRAKRKRKLAIMLPTNFPTPVKKPALSEAKPNVTPLPVHVNNSTPKGPLLLAHLVSDTTPVTIDANNLGHISDHDYCLNTPTPAPKHLTLSEYKAMRMNEPSTISCLDEQFVNEVVIDAGDTCSVDADIVIPTNVNVNSPCVEPVVLPPVKPPRDTGGRGRKSRRSYRPKREDASLDDGKYFDKIPAYFTTLTKAAKPPKEKKVVHGIQREDFIARDSSPSRLDPGMYSKLPNYYSCFTNSTKYDDQQELAYDSLEDYPCAKKSKRFKSSRSRSRSCSHSRSRSCSRSRSRRRSFRRRSYSSASGYSSSSSSSSGSSSDSRSRSRSYSHSRSYRSYSRSHSRSRSRYSRSRSQSRRRRSYTRSRSRSRCDSIERQRRSRQVQREREKDMQIEERRIVYVGKIPNGSTKAELRKRFKRFGDIDNISVHFREFGDNYGFVTFAYTCDAYAAIENGNKIVGEMRVDLCFGGRRQFCATDYADLDHEIEAKEEFSPIPESSGSVDFDQLLKQAKQKIKRKR